MGAEARGVALLLLAVAPLACSILTDLSNLGPRGDAADTGVGDAFAPDGFSCATDPNTLCDNFDDHPFGALWTGYATNSGAIVLDDASAVSLPLSLLATAAGDDAGEGQPILQKTFPTSASRFRCELDIRLDSVSLGGDVVPFYVELVSADPNVSSYHFTLDFEDVSAASFSEYVAYADGGELNPGTPVPPMPQGAWRHFAIDARFTDGTIEIDDGTDVSVLPIHPPAQTSGLTVAIGIYAEIGATGWAVRHDNVMCAVTP